MKKALFALLLSPFIGLSQTTPVTTATTALSGEIHIGSSNSASYKTITSAVNALNSRGISAPVTLLLDDANYSNATGETFPIVINAVKGASSTNTITIKPNAGTNVKVTASNINDWTGIPAIFILKGADYVTFNGSNTASGTSKNLTLVNTDKVESVGRSIIWVASEGSNAATDNTIKNVVLRHTVKNQGGQLIVGVYSSEYASGNSLSGDGASSDNTNLKITDNDFQNLKQGVYVNGGNTVTTNTFVKGNDLGSSDNTETIICPATFVNAKGFIYTENLVYNLYRATTDGSLISAGIYVGGNSSNGTISRNQMRNLTKTTTESHTFAGVVLASSNATANILVVNNFIANVSGNNNGGPALNGHGISIISGGGYKIYFNTVSLNTNQLSQWGGKGFSAALYVEKATNVDVRNNIFVNNQTEVNTRRTAILANGPASMFSKLDYNNVYSADKIGYVGDNASWFENWDYQTTLSGWKVKTGKEANSVSVNPVFVSATDLHIDTTNAVNAAFDNKATAISGITVDVDGQRRNATPDMGADEFGVFGFPNAGDNTGVYCDGATTWNGTKWTNGDPTNTKDAIFAANYTVSGSTFYACSVYVLNGASVEFTGNSTATITHSVNVQETGHLTFRSGSNLIQIEEARNTGTVIVEREGGSLKRNDYTIWTSPVVDYRTTGFQTLKSFSPLTADGRIYTYNTASGSAGLYGAIDAASTKFALGKGYLVRMPNQLPDSGATKGYNQGKTRVVFTASFEGTPNNGTVTLPLTYTDASHAFNAIGNPYPSSVSVAEFLAANTENIVGTVWIWRKTNDSSQSSYSTCNRSGYVANTAPGGDGKDGNDRIADPFAISAKGSLNTGQGFIVKAKGANKTVVFNNSMRLDSHSTSFFKQTGATTDADATADRVDRVKLNITSETEFSQALIAYNPETTLKIDEGFDSEKIGVSGLNLYSVAEAETGSVKQLGIQTRGAFDIADHVTLGYKAETAGTYTIKIDETTGVFASGQKVYLQDNNEGVIRELSRNSYTFDSEAGSFADRFTVFYTTDDSALGTDTPVVTTKETVVYNNNNEVKVAAAQPIKSVVIYDTLGRTIYNNAKVNTTEFASGTLTVAKQVVIVNVALENGQVVSKKIMMN